MHTQSDPQLGQWSCTFVETLARIIISCHADKVEVCLHPPFQSSVERSHAADVHSVRRL